MKTLRVGWIVRGFAGFEDRGDFPYLSEKGILLLFSEWLKMLVSTLIKCEPR